MAYRPITINQLGAPDIRGAKEYLQEVEQELGTWEPRDGRHVARFHLACGLYLFCRRNKNGRISRYFVARICVNTKVQETGLGSLKNTTWQRALARIVKLHRAAHEERLAAQRADPYWGHVRPRTRGKVTDAPRSKGRNSSQFHV